MKIEDKTKMISVLESFTDQMFNRYYITNPPTIKKNDKGVQRLGYGSNKTKETQSINFLFSTTKPSESEIKTFIKIFVEMWDKGGVRWVSTK